ncbi:hypothetical protein V1477_019102 [Vespula maculifrons]|uniref:Uncharacterized protein n=1 Tax=Vespula maculifrons TaxID=7453 RepID=A0ABD2ARL2_VESMC
MSTEVMAEEGQRVGKVNFVWSSLLFPSSSRKHPYPNAQEFLGEKESFEKSARNSESGNGRSSNRMRKEGGRASTAGVWAETTSGNVIAPRIQKGNRDRACRKRESNLLFVVCCQYRVSSNNSSSSDKFALLQILLKVLLISSAKKIVYRPRQKRGLSETEILPLKMEIDWRSIVATKCIEKE